jgi:DNA mismatch repair protein MutL
MYIRKLPAQEAQKIAAGEVVERPANIVKELIENSLDAKATRITVTLEQGGKELIEVSDNGSGMLKEDALICFERHTTSKLSSFNELESIHTFGFRGEALASMCSVAQVTITTKHKSSSEGLSLAIDQGEIIKESIVAHQKGSTIEIKKLFDAVPARRKFLKTTTTEWNHNTALFKAFCFSNLNVHFTLKHEGSIVYNCPPVKTAAERIEQLFDLNIAPQVIPLTESNRKEVTLEGALTGQHYSRYDRGGLFFFVNNRWVKNYKLATSLMKGYMNVLQPGKFPIAVIKITLDPKTVDINIHPKKEEVQFLHPRIVEQALTETVKKSLESALSKQLHKTVSFAAPPPQFNFETSPFEPLTKKKPLPELSSLPIPTQHETGPVPLEAIVQKEIEETPYKLIGQFKKTYLLLDHTDGLFIVDQHAAHERILYEQFVTRFQNQETVKLLFPQIIELSAEDFKTITPHIQLFIDHGITLEPFGTQQLSVTSTPVYAKRINIQELVHELISVIRTTHQTDPEIFFKRITEHMRAQMACKAAVKAGDELSVEKAEQLLKDLQKTANRFSCPHGRPTSWLLDTLGIEKKFKRKL